MGGRCAAAPCNNAAGVLDKKAAIITRVVMRASPSIDPAPSVSVEHFELRAADGCRLGATLFSPPNTPRGTVIIHGATATPQSYYRRFAYFLSGVIGVRV